MEEYKTVNKTIHYRIIDLMEFGIESYIQVDTLLIEMAKPVTQLDMSTVPDTKKKKLFFSIMSFKERSKKRLESYTEDGIKQVLIQYWLPTLPEEYKQALVAEFNFVLGFDSDGYAIFNTDFYNKWLDIKKKEKETRLVTYKKMLPTGVSKGGGNGSVGILGDPDNYRVYYPQCDNGSWHAESHITAEQWYKIIKQTSSKIKTMLQCFLQLPEPHIASCSMIERLFGVRNGSINSCNTALGQKAQLMMGDIAYRDAVEPHRERFWYYAMASGKNNNEGYFDWQPRPEVMEAAARLAKEENWKEIKRISS